jgi:PAS domain S-box-containing protein
MLVDMTEEEADSTRTGFFRRLSGLGSRVRLLLPGASRDITEHKQAEEELRRTHDELEQLVQGGAAQLHAINETLQAQVIQRQRAEQALAAERNLLRGLIDNLPDRIYVRDRQCRYLNDNIAHAQFLGASTPDNVVGKSVADFLPVAQAEQYEATDRQVMESNQPLLNIEEVITQSDGARRWALTTKVPLHDARGHVVGIVGISRDITQRKETELAFAKQRSQLDALMDNIPDAIYFKDRQSRFTLINRAQANRFSLTDPAQAVGKTDFDFFSQEHAQPAFDDEQEVIRTGQPVVGKEEKETWPDGHETWVSTTKEPLRDQTGKIIGTFGISRDITEHKKSEDELKFAYLELENNREELLEALENLKKAHEQLKAAQLQLIQAEKLQSVGRLAAGVAHEVKNPLAIITLGLDYLAADLGPNDAIAAQVISDTQAALKRADSIVHGLLNFAVPHELDLHDGQINEVVDQSLRLLKHPLALGHIVVVRKLKDNLPLLHLDHIKIQQVFINLFLNAIQAMPNGGTLTIRTDTRRLDPSEARRDAGDRSAEHFRAGELVVVTEVDDTGTGIPPDALAKVFDPFFTTKPAGQGTGLGLTVAQKIVELHGGRIDVRNRPKGGVRATITFPTKEG